MEKETLYKFFDGKASREEKEAVRIWLESSPENEQELFKEREFFDALLLTGSTKVAGMEKKSRPFYRTVLLEAIKIAAVFAITVASGTYFYKSEICKIGEAMNTITVPAGQRANLTLADGTNVWLNARSEMRYPAVFTGNKREITLDGEAYFEVAKNKEIPFYVNTETNQVRVVGTHFNVCAYKGSNEFETTLVEGIVDIYAYDNERPLTRLTKNEFFGSYQGKYKKAVLPSYDYLRWREGLYCFDDSPFSCILTKLEKYYNVKITVENPKVLNYRCTGKFKEQDGVEHILKVIQKDHPFTYTIREEGDSIRIE